MGWSITVYESMNKELCFLPEDTPEKIFRDNGIKGDLNYDKVNKYWFSSFFYPVNSIGGNSLNETKNQLLFEKKYNVDIHWDLLQLHNIVYDYNMYINYIEGLINKYPFLKYFEFPKKITIEDQWNNYIDLYRWLKKLPNGSIVDKDYY